MLNEAIAIGKDVEEAKENARAALKAEITDDVNFEVLEMGSRGIFGIIGVKPAKVRAWMEIPDTEKPHRGDRPHGENKRNKNKRDNKREKFFQWVLVYYRETFFIVCNFVIM